MNELKLIGTIGTPGLTSQDIKAQLAEMDDSEELQIEIDSNGGSVIQGFSIYNALNEYAGRIVAMIEPAAFSIASYIAMAADEIQIAPNGFFMVHKPMVDAQGADEDDLAKNLKLLGDIKTSMVEAYSKRTNMTADEVLAMLETETFLNAQESIVKGFADSISGEPVQSRFALTASVPEPVAVALAKGGTLPEKKKEPQIMAATIKEIKDRFPTAKAEFVLACIEKEMPIAEVAEAMVEEVQGENASLSDRIKELETENAELKTAQTEAAEAEAKAKLEAEAKAEAKKTGVDPVANPTSGDTTATAEWKDAIAAEVKGGLPKAKAVQLVNRKNPGLRERYLAEVNA